jgi:hypothetical protein
VLPPLWLSSGLAMRLPPSTLSCTRSDLLVTAAACTSLAFPGRLLAATPAAADPALRELLARMQDGQPKQQSLIFPTDGLGRGGGGDKLTFPPWMEGRWAVTSRPLSIAAPLGRRYLPTDLSRVKTGDLRDLGAPPLRYEVRFARRSTDGAIISDRPNNLRAVQDAAAGFSRVESASYDGRGKLSVSYSPFGRNGTYPGPSRAEVYINWRRQSAPAADASTFVFAEATRTVYLAQQRELSTISDAETICSFERVPAAEAAAGERVVRARQRVLRYLTPNPNSVEGVLWSEAGGRAVASLEYELDLVRLGPTADM